MSLQVWLPLNGNINNYGLSSSVAINSGAVVDNSGKIGKCYSFDGTDDGIAIQGLDLSERSELSVALWVYPLTTTLKNILSFERDTYWQFSFYDNYISIRDNGVGYTGDRKNIPLGSFEANKWIHIAVTYNKGTVKIYRNGELFSTSTTSGTALNSGINNYVIGRAYQGGTYFANDKINDVRIYDECLSDKQIKEISKGLILHYKLDSFDYNTNLIKSLSAGGQTTVTNNKIVTSGVNADTYFYINVETPLILNKSYTISCIGDNFPEGTSFSFPIGSQQNTSKTFIIKQGYNEYTFTANDTIVNAGKKIILDDTARSAYTNKCEFSNFYLTANDAVKDCSGYKQNGLVSGELSLQKNAARYGLSTVFNGSSCIKNNNFVFNDKQWSVSAWYYHSQTLSGYEGIICLSQGDGSDANKKFAIMPNNNFIWFKAESGAVSVQNISILNQWTQIVLTCDGTTAKIYMNGEYISSVSPGTILTGRTDLVVGARAASSGAETTSIYYNGNLNDIRIYATALSAEDIKELYEVTQSIDKNGNIYCYEFIEE